MVDTIDIMINDDGSEQVLTDISKFRSFIETLFSNDSCDRDSKLTGTVINEPTYGFSIERLMFSIGGRLITADYIVNHPFIFILNINNLLIENVIMFKW